MIGILYICTGKYDVFWKKFFLTCERYFLPGYEKKYFVFTDAVYIYAEESDKIQKIYQQALGWPYNTLLRFKIFLNAEEDLKKCGYLFFFNANIKFVDNVNDDILPGDSNDGLLAVKHPGLWDKQNEHFTYDRNIDSTAYIPFGQGKHYFMGGFNGGKAEAFLQLIKTLNSNIQKDLDKGIIAIWHDESHLNNYLLNRNPKVLSPEYGYAEGYNMPFKAKLIILDKSEFGGQEYLRSNTNKKEKKSITYIAKRSIKKFLKKLSSFKSS